MHPTETLWQNAFAVDEIAKRMSYKEYAQAEAIARLWEGNSPREEALRVLVCPRKEDKLFRVKLLRNLNVFNLVLCNFCSEENSSVNDCPSYP